MSAILLKQKYAEEKYDSDPPLQRVVRKGELVLEIPPKDRITRTDGSPSHNYCLYSNNAVTLYDDGIGMAPLEGAELDYLLAITEPPKRIIQYLEPRKMKWIMELKHGDIVSFRLPQGSNAVLMPKGRVRHYGRIPGHEGVMFGIEILVRAYCYCLCGSVTVELGSILLTLYYYYNRIVTVRARVTVMVALTSSVDTTMLSMYQWTRLSNWIKQ